ncbi:MAG TPA: DUF507 family protein [Polyangium sp.]|nr:DUF507 family protein [Polyangium sp.]
MARTFRELVPGETFSGGGRCPAHLTDTDRSMRLFSGKITPLSEELVKALAEGGELECEDRKEVVRDIESVFSQYLATDRDVSEKTKSTLESRGLPQSEYGRIRKLIAEQKGIKVGEDMLDYLLDQCIEMLLHSNNVDEVFGGDHDLRRRMRPILKKYLAADEELDVEVRSKLKHVQEGTRTWEIEYKRIAGDIQRRKGLS